MHPVGKRTEEWGLDPLSSLVARRAVRMLERWFAKASAACAELFRLDC